QKRLSPQSWADGGLLEALDAERGFRRILRATDAVSIVVTTLFQRGSLPYTLGTMLVALIALVTPVALTQSPLPANLVLFHHPLELIVLPVAGLAALGAARSRRRLRAAVRVAVAGYTVARRLLMAGAPAVAATRVRVEPD